MRRKQNPESLPDDALLRRLEELLHESRRVESELVAHIAEVDARRLYASRAASSMFRYAVEVLRLSEAEAYLRIAAARASRKHPVLLDMLADGRLHLSAIALLAPHLTESNRDAVLARAAHKTKREIEELVAELAPRPDVAPTIRKQPARAELAPQLRPDGVHAPETRPMPAAVQPKPPPTKKPAVEPLAPERYKVTFTADTELRDKLRRLEALMQSDLAEVIDAAVTEKLERLEAARFAKTRSPRKAVEQTDTSATGSRYIQAAVKRAVCARDGDRCTFVDATGRRCTERDQLEFHHDDPYAKGGDRGVDNVRLLCKTHNLYLAEREYGKDVMNAFRGPNDRVSEPMPTYSVRTELPNVWLARPGGVPFKGVAAPPTSCGRLSGRTRWSGLIKRDGKDWTIVGDCPPSAH